LEEDFSITSLIKILLVIVGIVLFFCILYWALLPVNKAVETTTIRQSNEYINAKESMLIDRMYQYNKLQIKINDYIQAGISESNKLVTDMKSAQESILISMRSEAKRLQSNKIG